VKENKENIEDGPSKYSLAHNEIKQSCPQVYEDSEGISLFGIYLKIAPTA